MFESTETIETIYLKFRCGAEFNRKCIAYVGDEEPTPTNPKLRVYLAELAADEWLDFHKGCYLPSIFQVPFNPESLGENLMS